MPFMKKPGEEEPKGGGGRNFHLWSHWKFGKLQVDLQLPTHLLHDLVQATYLLSFVGLFANRDNYICLRKMLWETNKVAHTSAWLESGPQKVISKW